MWAELLDNFRLAAKLQGKETLSARFHTGLHISLVYRLFWLRFSRVASPFSLGLYCFHCFLHYCHSSFAKANLPIIFPGFSSGCSFWTESSRIRASSRITKSTFSSRKSGDAI